MFKNIVLAIDRTDHAAKATDVAADMAAQYGATLTLVTVLPEFWTLSEVEAMPQAEEFSPEVKDGIRQFHEATASHAGTRFPETITPGPAPISAIAALGEAILDAAEVKARNKKVKKIKRAAVTGHPAEAIVAVAKKARADLIVLGTRGLSELEGVFLGSVSHQVMHLAACPCLTVK